jgi:hypothetical protein
MSDQILPTAYRTIDSLKSLLTMVKNNSQSDSEKASQRARHIARYKILNPGDNTVDAAVASV